MQFDISVTEVEPQIVLVRHVVVDEVDLGTTIGQTFAEAYDCIGRSAMEPAGPPFVIYHHGPDGGRWEADICAPVVRSSGRPPEGFTFQTIAGGPAITTLVRGPYSMLPAAYGVAGDWAKEHQFEFAGSPRECYLSEPGTPEDEIETVLEWPVRPQPVHASARGTA
jgi:effector-binding domain-containing protein